MEENKPNDEELINQESNQKEKQGPSVALMGIGTVALIGGIVLSRILDMPILKFFGIGIWLTTLLLRYVDKS